MGLFWWYLKLKPQLIWIHILLVSTWIWSKYPKFTSPRYTRSHPIPLWQLHSNPFEWNTSNPAQMSPTKITTKPLVIMYNGLLTDHSRNTIGMDLIVIFILFYFLVVAYRWNGSHVFFTSAWNAIWNGPPLPMQLYFTCKVFVKSWKVCN